MTAREYIRKNLNVPNVLTIIRLLLVPVYVICFACGQKMTALMVFLVASFTDLLDGRIARKYNLITDFGKLMDPFADKVMVLTAMCSMAIGNGAIPAVIPWPAVVILLAKELVLVIGGWKLLKKGMVVHSIMIGKVAHCVFIGGLMATYFHDWFVQRCPAWPMTPDVMLIWLAVILTLIAMVTYVVRAIRAARQAGILPQK